MEDALRFIVGQGVLSFGWNESYDAITGRHERLRDVPTAELARARAVPPDGDVSAPTDAWDIVVDHVPEETHPAEVERRCRQAFASVRPVLRLMMRRDSGSPTRQCSGCR